MNLISILRIAAATFTAVGAFVGQADLVVMERWAVSCPTLVNLTTPVPIPIFWKALIFLPWAIIFAFQIKNIHSRRFSAASLAAVLAGGAYTALDISDLHTASIDNICDPQHSFYFVLSEFSMPFLFAALFVLIRAFNAATEYMSGERG